MKQRKPSLFEHPTFSRLFGFASISTAILSAVSLFALNFREWDIRGKPYYQLAMKKWNESETARFLIGEPIKLKYVRIFNKATFLGDQKATFFIPFKGQRYNGRMNVNASVEQNEWILKELTLELDGDMRDKKFVVYRIKQDEQENESKHAMNDNVKSDDEVDKSDEEKSKGEN